MEPDRERFVRELTTLTQKYGIAVDGCGCCGSPFLIKAKTGPEYGYTQIGDSILWTSLNQEKKQI